MRILHIGQFQLNSASGAYNAIWNLAKAQAQLGHQVTIVSPAKSVSKFDKERALKDNVVLDSINFNTFSERWFFGLTKAQYLLDKFNPDIIHFQYVREPFYLSIINVAKKKGIPCIISLHGGWRLGVIKRSKSFLKLSYWFIFDRRIITKCSGVHFVSDVEYKEYKVLQNVKKYAIIPNGVNLEFNEAAIYAKNENLNDLFKIGYLGRFDIQNKGLDLLSEMIKYLMGNNLVIECHLYGKVRSREREQWEDYLKNIKSLPIFAHPPVYGEEKSRVIKSFDLYIQYSRWELFGISIIEAMLAGVPVAISEKCDYAKKIEESGGGIILPMHPHSAAEKISSLIRNRDLLKEMGIKGKRWAEKEFDPLRIAGEMISFYEDIIATK